MFHWNIQNWFMCNVTQCGLSTENLHWQIHRKKTPQSDKDGCHKQTGPQTIYFEINVYYV